MNHFLEIIVFVADRHRPLELRKRRIGLIVVIGDQRRLLVGDWRLLFSDGLHHVDGLLRVRVFVLVVFVVVDVGLAVVNLGKEVNGMYELDEDDESGKRQYDYRRNGRVLVIGRGAGYAFLLSLSYIHDTSGSLTENIC